MSKASKYPADHTLRFYQPISPTFQMDPPQKIPPFTFASPVDHLLDFSGPRGDEYVNSCKVLMADAVKWCVWLTYTAALCGVGNCVLERLHCRMTPALLPLQDGELGGCAQRA